MDAHHRDGHGHPYYSSSPLSLAAAAANGSATPLPPGPNAGGASPSPSASNHASDPASPAPVRTYDDAVGGRLLYSDPATHVAVLRLVLGLLLTPEGGLDPAYFEQFPLDNGKPNVEHVLLWHLNSTACQAVVPQLLLAASAGPAPVAAHLEGAAAAGATRLLRLLCRQLFNASCYTNLQFQARGAFGGIYRARREVPAGGTAGGGGSNDGLGHGSEAVMIKTIELPSSPYDACVLADVFGEVSILERYRGCEGVCQLLDYGLQGRAFWLVMRRYRCSLAEWRARQHAAPTQPAAALLYLRVLRQVRQGGPGWAREGNGGGEGLGRGSCCCR